MKFPWWQWLPLHGWRVVGTVESADEIPLKLPRNGAILVGSQVKPKWVAFDCPCRTGHRIMLNADRTRRPYWQALDIRRLTLSPSVDYLTSHQRCHYIIRNGRVEWVHRRTDR